MTIDGTTISPGLAEGKIRLHRGLLGLIDAPGDIGREEVDDELSRLDVATAKIGEDLLVLATRVEEEIDSRLAEVFGAHQMILGDSSLQDELRREITENLVSAGSAVKSVFLRWENRFLLRESQIARDKGDDLRDLSIRLRKALAGVGAHPYDEIAEGSILAAPRLLPSDAVLLGGGGASAILLEHGSIGSHASLFVREMGIPCVSGLSGLLEKATEDEWVLVDADRATVTLNPRDEDRVGFRKRVGDLERTRQLAQQRAQRSAVTRDEVTISVFANVGCSEDTSRAIENGAEGVGLYRIERAYLGRVSPPNSEELLAEMKQTLAPARGRPVCVRLLDIGADKPLPFMRFMAETNPSLGRRGIRYLREYPELLRTHLGALLQLAREFEVRILVPMVTLPDDVAIVKEVLGELATEMRSPRLHPAL